MLQSILIRFDKSHDSQILELHMGQELEVMGICRGLNSDNSVVVDAK
jgi:hypothetical protein